MKGLKAYVMGKLSRRLSTQGRVVGEFARLNDLEDVAGLRLIQEIRTKNQMLLKDAEAFLIYKMVKKTEKIPGEIAEVGVYKGASAKLIRKATHKNIYLFDTFEGLPDAGREDKQNKFKKGELSASLEGVQEYLKGEPGIAFYKGLFPSTAGPVADKKFSFVHLDVDLYESTLECLTFFYPRMSPGGAIVSHDYASLVGVKKAFDEFFAEKPEIILQPLGTSQALVLKVALS